MYILSDGCLIKSYCAYIDINGEGSSIDLGIKYDIPSGLLRSWIRMYNDEASLRYAIKDYLRFYSEEGPQDRYHCKTPLEVRQEALASDVPAEYPIPENKRINKYKEKWCA